MYRAVVRMAQFRYHSPIHSRVRIDQRAKSDSIRPKTNPDATRLAKDAANETHPKKKAEAEEKARNALDAARIAQSRVNIAQYQIPIVSFGLDGKAFKCLETRPGVVKKLNQLLTVSVDPLDKVSGALKMELLESRCCINEEGKSCDELPEAA
jgi:hypothetical protein